MTEKENQDANPDCACWRQRIADSRDEVVQPMKKKQPKQHKSSANTWAERECGVTLFK